jgi:hypothetical protein
VGEQGRATGNIEHERFEGRLGNQLGNRQLAVALVAIRAAAARIDEIEARAEEQPGVFVADEDAVLVRDPRRP